MWLSYIPADAEVVGAVSVALPCIMASCLTLLIVRLPGGAFGLMPWEGAL